MHGYDSYSLVHYSNVCETSISAGGLREDVSHCAASQGMDIDHPTMDAHRIQKPTASAEPPATGTAKGQVAFWNTT